MNPAQKKAVEIVKQIAAKLFICPGLKEVEVAEWIRLELCRYGAKPAFRIIVASGRRAALPHGFATQKVIRSGEMVVIDFGALYQGECSDITRTLFVSRPNVRQNKIYNIVKEAQRRAIGKVKAGRPCNEVDKTARDYIKKKKLGHCFIHTTGHGIGQKVHQRPKISLKNSKKLEVGMVITIEPGIYIKGWGGVRIEDMVLVTKSGCKVLT
jgi:Xaa-Pro aminopeptidase